MSSTTALTKYSKAKTAKNKDRFKVLLQEVPIDTTLDQINSIFDNQNHPNAQKIKRPLWTLEEKNTVHQKIRRMFTQHAEKIIAAFTQKVQNGPPPAIVHTQIYIPS